MGGFDFRPALLCQSDPSPLRVQSLAATVASEAVFPSVCRVFCSRVTVGGFFQPSLSVLYMLSDGATHEAVHLLCRMLVFDPVSLFWPLDGRG